MNDADLEFVRLWTRHQAEVGRYVYMMVPRQRDAAEILQDVSVRLWEKWDHYDHDRPFVPWAIRFAYLEILKWRQSASRERLVFSDALLERLHDRYDERQHLTEARQRALEDCLAKLSVQERKWITLRYGRHGAVKDEAERSGIKVHKLYYALEVIREGLLRCISETLKHEGWSEA